MGRALILLRVQEKERRQLSKPADTWGEWSLHGVLIVILHRHQESSHAGAGELAVAGGVIKVDLGVG